MLITLLEAFIYDPLVDWMAERLHFKTIFNFIRDNDVKSKMEELHISLSLFVSRLQDQTIAINSKAKEYSSSLGELETILSQLLMIAKGKELLEQAIQQDEKSVVDIDSSISQLQQEVKQVLSLVYH